MGSFFYLFKIKVYNYTHENYKHSGDISKYDIYLHVYAVYLEIYFTQCSPANSFVEK